MSDPNLEDYKLSRPVLAWLNNRRQGIVASSITDLRYESISSKSQEISYCLCILNPNIIIFKRWY